MCKLGSLERYASEITLRPACNVHIKINDHLAKTVSVLVDV